MKFWGLVNFIAIVGFNKKGNRLKSNTTNLKPGEARCPDHPTTKQLVMRDATGAPDSILEESYQFLGDEDISFEHYTSDEFSEEENHGKSKNASKIGIDGGVIFD